MNMDESEKSLPNFTETEEHVFQEKGGEVYIGGVKVTHEIRSLLRDEAEYIQKSRLWEILNASVTNEAYSLALIQSKDFDNVLSAKMLHHWAHFMRNVLHNLAKK